MPWRGDPLPPPPGWDSVAQLRRVRVDLGASYAAWRAALPPPMDTAHLPRWAGLVEGRPGPAPGSARGDRSPVGWGFERLVLSYSARSHAAPRPPTPATPPPIWQASSRGWGPGTIHPAGTFGVGGARCVAGPGGGRGGGARAGHPVPLREPRQGGRRSPAVVGHGHGSAALNRRATGRGRNLYIHDRMRTCHAWRGIVRLWVCQASVEGSGRPGGPVSGAGSRPPCVRRLPGLEVGPHGREIVGVGTVRAVRALCRPAGHPSRASPPPSRGIVRPPRVPGPGCRPGRRGGCYGPK